MADCVADNVFVKGEVTTSFHGVRASRNRCVIFTLSSFSRSDCEHPCVVDLLCWVLLSIFVFFFFYIPPWSSQDKLAQMFCEHCDQKRLNRTGQVDSYCQTATAILLENTQSSVSLACYLSGHHRDNVFGPNFAL